MRTLCIVDVVDSRPMRKHDEASAGVEWRPGAWAWVLRHPRAVPRDSVVGRLGIFEVQDPREPRPRL